jgi:molybdopterin-guanine dinucleotide biosynthesis protein A
LAGGESRRFGRDKASEVVAGMPLVSRAAETLAEVLTRVVVVSSRVPTCEWPSLPDLRVGLGPLAGIESALTHAVELGLDGALVLACDLPLIDADMVREIVSALGPNTLAAAPARLGEPGVEPLCAAYRSRCLTPVRRALDEGELAVHRLFARVGGITVRVPPDRLLNVNRPADRERAEAMLRHRAR